jgi:glycosyltransferase involved in cell wall biosynthesis
MDTERDRIPQEAAATCGRRVLQVVEANVGGVKSVLQELVPALVRVGFDVTVAYSPRRGSESEEAAKTYAESGAHVIPVGMRRSIEPWSDIRSLANLVSLMRGGDYQIVHCHSSKAGVLGRIAARASRVPRCLYSPHGFALDGARTRLTAWFFAGIERMLIPWTSRLVAVSKYEARQASKLGVPQESLSVIPNGVRGYLQPRRERERILRFGGAGRLVRQKGFDVLIQAFHEVWRKYPETQLVIAGEGPMRHRLRRTADQLGVPVELPGPVRPLQDFFDSIDVFVHPARWESMPLVLLEAMGAGVPVVATTVGGISEIVEHDKSGLLVAPDDPKSLAASMIEALTHPDAARKRSLQARRDVQESHNLDRSLELYIGLYNRILTTPSPSPEMGQSRDSVRSAAKGSDSNRARRSDG